MTGFIQSNLDLKLLVLYIITRAAAPITFLQLMELALCDAGVDYFSLHQAVSDLVQRENLQQTEDFYEITDKGRRNSEIWESSLPYSVRRRCDENLSRLNQIIMREQQVQGQALENEDGTVTVHLRLSDDSGLLMELKLLSPTGEMAQAMIRRYKEMPEATYHRITALLLEETQKADDKA